MCTLTFIPREKGFLIAMNRDERLSRETAQPPARFEVGGHHAIFPYESSGGTWIGGNDSGLAFAILNQSIENGGAKKQRSRGTIIPKLLAASSLTEIQVTMQQLELAGTLPFRLVAVIPGEKIIGEWMWNASQLEHQIHPWQQRHWFSSGKGDELATRKRGAVCQAAWEQPKAGSLDWLRQLHRSHLPERGAFSICVHREDAHTVSYTELLFDQGTLQVRYRPGPPCSRSRIYTARLCANDQSPRSMHNKI